VGDVPDGRRQAWPMRGERWNGPGGVAVVVTCNAPNDVAVGERLNGPDSATVVVTCDVPDDVAVGERLTDRTAWPWP